MEIPTFDTIIKELDAINGLSNGTKRRDELLVLMEEVLDAGKNCYSCQGFCCTSAHNSMLVTPIEALDSYQYFFEKGQIDQKLIDCLNKNIKEFRLDNEMSIGRGRVFRRNYTCPFFNTGAKGCSIGPRHKPYGCLGFNALEKNVLESGHCTSYTDVLNTREERCSSEELELNEFLKKRLSLYWDKKNLPLALLEIIQKFP